MYASDESYPCAMVKVCSVNVTGPHLDFKPRPKEVFFDAVVSDVDGRFKTERLLPGKYAIVAEAYSAETKPDDEGLSEDPDKMQARVVPPGFVGRTVVTRARERRAAQGDRRNEAVQNAAAGEMTLLDHA